MKFSLFVLLVCAAVCLFHLTSARVSKKYKWKCNAKDEAEIDDLASKVITLGRKDMKLPRTTKEIKPFCKQELTLLAKGESYKDQCMKGSQKQVFSVAIYSLRTFINQLCRRPKSKKTQDLLKSVPCINDGEEGYAQCNHQYIDMLDQVQEAPFKTQISTLCCGYFGLFKCMREAGAKVATCTPKRIEMLLDLVKLNAENMVNMLCGEYSENNDKCDSVKLNRTPQAPEKRSKSFVKPLISILGTEDAVL